MTGQKPKHRRSADAGDPQEERLRALIAAAYPAEYPSPSEALAAEVAAIAAGHQARAAAGEHARDRGHLWRGIWLASAATVVLVLILDLARGGGDRSGERFATLHANDRGYDRGPTAAAVVPSVGA